MVSLVLAAVSGALAGAVLASVAFRMRASDDRPDWRGSSRPVQVGTAVACAVVSGLSAALAVRLASVGGAVLGVGAFAVVGPGMAVIEQASRRLPFAVTGAVAGLGIAGQLSDPGMLTSSLVAAGIVGLVALALSLATGGGAGLGDIAYAAVAALTLAWAGWAVVVLCFLVALALPPVALAVIRVAHGRWILLPFGPYVLLGWWVALVSGTIGFLA